jgi:ABC-type lipoprotein export system ATPase subunit
MQEMTKQTQTPGDSAAFQAIGIEKYYEEVGSRIDVLKGVNLHLHQGEMIAIVGASGTGKTTLLHILGTLDRPTAGKLLYDGIEILKKNDIELSAYRNKKVAFVFQFHHLLPEFTALENVMMPVQGTTKSRWLKRLRKFSKKSSYQTAYNIRWVSFPAANSNGSLWPGP